MGSAIRKLSIVLLSLAVLATLLILAGIYVSYNYSPLAEKGGMAEKQADTAIDLAIHNPLFMSSYNPSQDKYWVGKVMPSTFSEYGLSILRAHM